MSLADALCGAGSILAGYGLYLIHPSAMLVGVGVLLVCFGVANQRKGRTP